MWALDLAGWQVFNGLRRVQQAKREERCADRTCELWRARQFPAWLEDETAWWQVLAAAARATAEDGRAQLAVGSTDVGGESRRGGGGDGGGPGGGGDDTPHAGQRHEDHGDTNWCDNSASSEDMEGGSSGTGETGGGGDDTPLAGTTSQSCSRQWMEEIGERWGVQGAEGERRDVQGDRRADGVGEGSRSGRGARCYRLRGWRRWLVGRRGPAGRRRPCGAGAAPGSSVVHEPMRTRTRRRLAYGSRSLPPAAGWAAAFIGRRPGLELEMTMLTGLESDVYTPTHTKFLTACRGRDRVSF